MPLTFLDFENKRLTFPINKPSVCKINISEQKGFVIFQVLSTLGQDCFLGKWKGGDCGGLQQQQPRRKEF